MSKSEPTLQRKPRLLPEHDHNHNHGDDDDEEEEEEDHEVHDQMRVVSSLTMSD